MMLADYSSGLHCGEWRVTDSFIWCFKIQPEEEKAERGLYKCL